MVGRLPCAVGSMHTDWLVTNRTGELADTLPLVGLQARLRGSGFGWR